jgi:hypothetical protein
MEAPGPFYSLNLENDEIRYEKILFENRFFFAKGLLLTVKI